MRTSELVSPVAKKGIVSYFFQERKWVIGPRNYTPNYTPNYTFISKRNENYIHTKLVQICYSKFLCKAKNWKIIKMSHNK